jgi:hypothetical protein
LWAEIELMMNSKKWLNPVIPASGSDKATTREQSRNPEAIEVT